MQFSCRRFCLQVHRNSSVFYSRAPAKLRFAKQTLFLQGGEVCAQFDCVLQNTVSHQAVSSQRVNPRNLPAFYKTPFPRFAKQNTPPAFLQKRQPPTGAQFARVFAKNTVSASAPANPRFCKNANSPQVCSSIAFCFCAVLKRQLPASAQFVRTIWSYSVFYKNRTPLPTRC
jgi:hypothetical protein